MTAYYPIRGRSIRVEATCSSWSTPCCTRRYISPSILAIRSRLSPVPRRSRWCDHSSDDSALRCAESNRRPSATPWLSLRGSPLNSFRKRSGAFLPNETAERADTVPGEQFGQPPPPPRYTRARSRYSERNATDGVSEAAREAGTSVASISVESNTAIAPIMASGSEVCVPYSSERT